MKQVQNKQKFDNVFQDDDESKLYLQCDSYSKQLNLLQKIMSSFSWYEYGQNMLFHSQEQVKSSVNLSKPQQANIKTKNQKQHQQKGENITIKLKEILQEIKKQDYEKIKSSIGKQNVNRSSKANYRSDGVKFKGLSNQKKNGIYQKINKSTQYITKPVKLQNKLKSIFSKYKQRFLKSNLSKSDIQQNICTQKKITSLQRKQSINQDDLDQQNVLKAKIRVDKISKLIQKSKQKNDKREEQALSQNIKIKTARVQKKVNKSQYRNKENIRQKLINENNQNMKKGQLQQKFFLKLIEQKQHKLNQNCSQILQSNQKTTQKAGKIVKNQNNYLLINKQKSNQIIFDQKGCLLFTKIKMQQNIKQKPKQRKLNEFVNIKQEKNKILSEQAVVKKIKYLVLNSSQILQQKQTNYSKQNKEVNKESQTKQSCVIELPMTFQPSKYSAENEKNSQFTFDEGQQKLVYSSRHQSDKQDQKRKHYQQGFNRLTQKQIYTANSIIKEQQQFDISEQSGRTYEKSSRQTIDTFPNFNHSRNPTRPSQISDEQNQDSRKFDNKRLETKISESKYSRKSSLQSIVVQKYQFPSQNIKNGSFADQINFKNSLNNNIVKQNCIWSKKDQKYQFSQQEKENIIPKKYVYQNLEESDIQDIDLNKDPYLTLQSVPLSERYSQKQKNYTQDFNKLDSLNWRLQSQINKLKYRSIDWKNQLLG